MQAKVIRRLLTPYREYDSTARPDIVNLMNMAASSVTGGKFDTWESLIDYFMSDYDSYLDVEDFLLDACGIDLDNDDGGSIIGKDAGGNDVIPFSVINETIPLQQAPSSYTTKGLTIIFPSTNIQWQQNVYNAIYTWWLDPIIDYINDAYDLSLSGVTITTKFMDKPVGTLASVTSSIYASGTSAGLAFDYTLELSISAFQQIDFSIIPIDVVEIDTSPPPGAYIELAPDSVLLHEFTHAAIYKNMRWSNDIPAVISEGVPEVLCGHDIRAYNGGKSYYISDISDRSAFRQSLLSQNHNYSDGRDYGRASTFLRWLAKKFDSDDITLVKKGTPFLNKLIYKIILEDKKSSDVDVIINNAIKYATALDGVKTTYLLFIREYVSKLDTQDIDTSLLDIANIDFTNNDDGAYGGKDSKFVDYEIKRQDRFRILNIYSYLNQIDTLFYSFSYYAKYEKEEYKVRDLTINFVHMDNSTVNKFYKDSIISRLVRGIFKPILQCLDYYLNLRFDSFSYHRTIYIDFDDDPTPIRPCSYQVGFDTSGKVNSMLITFYTYAYIPIDDRDTMPALGYYTGNYLLYIFCIFIILSKLNNAQAFYRHPIIVAIAITLVGYDELGETDIKDTAVNGNTEQYAVGGIIGD